MFKNMFHKLSRFEEFCGIEPQVVLEGKLKGILATLNGRSCFVRLDGTIDGGQEIVTVPNGFEYKGHHWSEDGHFSSRKAYRKYAKKMAVLEAKRYQEWLRDHWEPCEEDGFLCGCCDHGRNNCPHWGTWTQY